MNKTSNSSPNPNQKDQDFNLEHFRIRLIARFGIFVVIFLLFIPRFVKLFIHSGNSSSYQLFASLTFPFQILMILIITLEYIFYKKLGARIVRYSSLVDILLLSSLMCEWTINTVGNLLNMKKEDTVCLYVGSLLAYTSFSWRTLMVMLIVQKWWLKIIPPATLLLLVAGFSLYYSPATRPTILVSIIVQFFILIILIYCEDKVKWRMIRANIQKEQWMRVNNFILNSLPENIIILGLDGEPKFISEYCKSFIDKCHLSADPKEFFKKVQDLKPQKFEPDEDRQSPSTSIIQIERLTTENNLLHTDDENLRNEGLDDLLIKIQAMIADKTIQEKQFLVYNGKLKIDENHPVKSLEVKISFVQHFENYYIILIIRDTTQRDLLMTLEEANKYKDQLLASVSHELRAPLNGNINLVESAVNSPKIPESLKETLLIPALRTSQFLLHMINDILDMSQIKEKKLRLVFSSANLKETLKSTAQLIELQAKKKGIGLLLDIDPSIPKKFCTDHIRLSQIVLNLLNNAIKFTQEGMIKLIAEPMDDDSSSIKISVEDSGIGMTQENVQKLFSSYTHIEFEGRQIMNPTGAGLGLNIAYNLAVLLGTKDHQGISVSSVLNHGSTFTFILENRQRELQDQLENSCDVTDESPEFAQIKLFSSENSLPISLIESKRASEDLSANANGGNVCSCPKILIVDDNPFNTMAFETILSSFEIGCESVYGGSACIKRLLNRQTNQCGKNCKQFSLVFMDQEMPEMNGSDTVREIKRLQEESLLSPSLRVIGCTAHKSKEEVEKFMKAGIDLCIHKPVSAAMIKDILKNYI